jgi:hypothetical protein
MKMEDMVGDGGTAWAGPMTLEHAEERARVEYEQYLNFLRMREEYLREGNRVRADEYRTLAEQVLPRYEATCRVLARVRAGKKVVFRPEAEV